MIVSCQAAPPSSSTQFIYFWYDEDDRQQLFLADLDDTLPVQLTSAEIRVGDTFDLTATQIVYTQQRADLSEQIWLLTLTPDGRVREDTLLHACEEASCKNPIWASDQQRILYERRNMVGEEPRLYWLNSKTGETIPVFDDEAVLGYRPQLSSDDRYLSFVYIPPAGDDVVPLLPQGHSLSDGHGHGNLLLNQQRVLVFDFETAEQVTLANLMNSGASWHDHSAEFLLTDIAFSGEQFGVHLMHVDPAERLMIDLSGDSIVDDASPVWSPDGDWILFNRKSPGTAMGRQIWRMRPDGSDAMALTDDATWHHAQVHFSADGNLLLFQRFDVTQPASDPGIWLLDQTTDEMKQLVAPGARPQWRVID